MVKGLYRAHALISPIVNAKTLNPKTLCLDRRLPKGGKGAFGVGKQYG